MRVSVALLLVACRLEWGAPTAPRLGSEEITVYTSLYPPVIEALNVLIKEAGLHVQFFQAGSEKLAARLDAERLGHNPGADLLVSSDPLYYAKLKAEGVLRPYASVRALRLDRQWVDLDGAFATCRVSTFGLVSRRDGPAPKRFSDLWAGEHAVTLPDPLGSGTMLTALLAWTVLYPDAVHALRAARVTASGGGTAVIDRLLHKEAAFGAALFENVKLAKNDSLVFTVPEEGAVLIPGYVAILTSARPGAERVYDLLLSERAQAVFVEAGMRSPFDLGAVKSLPYPNDPALAQAVRTAWAQ